MTQSKMEEFGSGGHCTLGAPHVFSPKITSGSIVEVTSTCIKCHWPTPVHTSLSLSQRVASSSAQGEEMFRSK